MTTLRRLVQFEYSRFSSLVPGLTRTGIQVALTYLVFLLAGAFYFLRNQDTPEVVFALGVALSWGIMMNLSLFHIMMIWAQPQREWWLTFPYPRLQLVGAKAIGLMRVSVRIVILILLACMIYYVLALALGMMNPMSAGKGLALIGASLLLAGSFIPVAIILGLTVSTMYSGWARLLLIPYIIIIQSPYVLLAILMEMEVSQFRYLSVSHMLLYTLGIVVIGWPLAYVMMRLIAGIGLRNMADVRLRMKSITSHKGEVTNKNKTRIADQRSAIATLYTLERSRFRYYGSIPAVRIIKYSLLAIIAAGAYFSSNYPIAVLEMLQVLFMLPVLVSSIYVMNKSSIDRKNMPWWLGFPVSRNHLLLAQLAGVWVTAVKIIAALSMAIWVGISVGLIAGRMEWQVVPGYLEWFMYALILYITILTLAISFIQSSYYFMKSKVLSILVIPQYLLVTFQGMIINEYLYPENFELYTQDPAWGMIGNLLVVGLPLAAICIQLGARHIHFSLGIEAKSLWQSQGK